jgi:O-antigen/teichoic acid export membrane protein
VAAWLFAVTDLEPRHNRRRFVLPAMPARSSDISRRHGASRSRDRRTGLAASAGLLALGSLFTQAAQIIALSVLARLVTKPELATYQQLNLLYALAAPLLLVGTPTALLYFVARARGADERRAWVLRAYILLGTTGLLAASSAVLFRHLIADAFNNPPLATAMIFYAPYLLCVFIAAATPPALVASGAARYAAVLNAAVGVFMLVALVTAAVIEPTGESLALGLSASGVALATASVFAVSRTLGLDATDHQLGKGLRSLLGYGLPMTVVALAGTIAFQFDRIVVGTSFSPHDFAIYALGAVEVPIFLLLGQAVTNVLMPALAQLWQNGDSAGMIALWHRSMRKMGVILLPSFVFLMIMAEDVIRVLFGPGYEESVVVFRIYLFLIPLRVANWSIIPTAMGWTRFYAPGVILLVANATIALAAVGPLGLPGPALAAPIATALAAFYYVWRLRPVLGLGLSGLVPFRPLATTLLVAVLASAPVLYVKQMPGGSALRLVVAACAYFAVVVPALRLARQISDEDWARVPRAVRHVLRPRAGRDAAAE